ncbi:MAG: hypothetical protein WC679_14060 [Bacteroidales bacterium]|jgi:hypothetical protein
MESKKSVKKVEQKDKLPPRTRYNQQVRDEVVSLAKQGLTLTQILAKVQPRKRAILRYLKKVNIEIPRD